MPSKKNNPSTRKKSKKELSIVLPCLNEELTVGACVSKAVNFLKKHKINGEVLVADNGSNDQSIKFAKRAGARVVNIEKKGYGSALRGGFEAAQGKFIIMADADDSYDLVNLMPFLERLREGYELVMGNRFKGGIKKELCPGITATLATQSFLFWESCFSKPLQMTFTADCAALQRRPSKK